MAIATPLAQQYFENEEFNHKLKEWYGEESDIVLSLSKLANDIIEEAKSDVFNFERVKSIMK